jgi:hypothetical protein
MNSTRKFFLASCFILTIPMMLISQDKTARRNLMMNMHQETQNDQYLPNPNNPVKTSPPFVFERSGFFSAQVNVDQNGQNILGDAANEPSIAIDPTDPENMVIGWRQFDNVYSSFRQAGYGYTTDGGLIWTFPGVINQGIFRSDPVLDYDINGTFYYNSLTSASSVYYCDVFRSTDGGATWDAGVDAHGGDKQWMTIDRSGGMGTGHIYSNWTAYYSNCLPGFFTRSTDGGNTYEDCIGIPGEPYWGTLAVGPDGELYVVGSDGWGAQVSKSTTAQDPAYVVIWENTTIVNMDGTLSGWSPVNPAGLTGQLYIDVDRSNSPSRGNVYVVASVERYSVYDPADVMFVKSTDGGITWSDPIRINDDPYTGKYQWFGTMSVAPNGRIDVIWLDTRDAEPGTYMSELYYSYSTDQGETWSINEKLSDAFDPHLGWPQQEKMGDYFEMESDNTYAHLAWAGTFNGEQDVYYGRITPPVTGIESGNTKVTAAITSFPNPFSDKATIRYTVPVSSKVKVEILTMYGSIVETVVNKALRPGTYTHYFSAANLTSGYYYCRITAGNSSATSGMVCVK